MGWTQVSQRRWERPVNGIEGYFTVLRNMIAPLCGGREHFTLFAKVKVEIDVSDAEGALRHAWKQIRYEQPQIATVVEDMKKVYEVPDETGLEEWLRATFIVSSASDAEELYRRAEPVSRATLYYVPLSSEILVRIPHYTIDAIGMLLLLHSYFRALENPAKDVRFGDEYTRLAPAVEDTLGQPEEPTPEQLKEAIDTARQWTREMPGIGPVSKAGKAPSGQSQNLEEVYSKEMTQRIVERCKEKGVTVTSAVHGAYIWMLRKYADPTGNLSRYVTAASINLRPYLAEPYGSSQYAASVYYAIISWAFDMPETYWDGVRLLNEKYQTAIKGNPVALEKSSHFTRGLCEVVQTPEFLANAVARDALPSSLGIVEQYLQRTYGSNIAVQDFKLGVDIVQGMCLLCIYTFNDQLRLVYNFNEGFEGASDIRRYLDEMKEVLERELLG